MSQVLLKLSVRSDDCPVEYLCLQGFFRNRFFLPLVSISSPASVLKLLSTRPLYGHNSVDLDQHPPGSRVGDPSTNGGKDDTAGNIELDKLIQ